MKPPWAQRGMKKCSGRNRFVRETVWPVKKEAKELGFDPWGDTAQEVFERLVTEMEKYALDNPEEDLEIMFYEQEGFSWLVL